ncbi:GNAT family N-acetyltransferase [Neptunicella marina]|uniref:GNAT family N-acetyltransferase n=1 Tax=Neptunicella marina TaxID=2125989 RepID=A0A8J6J102_9ALTE|nr:GNAT family N-acetyltransferase [Neptunicella marina]MBC3767717.1 GNAT family N-acetyltransferase [Neptunicella marina]
MYQLIEECVDVDTFLFLRQVSGLSPRPRAGAEIGLANSLYAVHICYEGTPVGMGRIVGDGGLNFDIVDIAVHPDHQGKGLGRKIMQAIMDYLEKNTLKGAYITLMADVPALYEKFGFTYTRPESEGMVLVR